MKSRTDYITLEIPSKMAFVNITPKVEEAIRKSGVKEGIVLCNSMHITSSVFINDDERGLHR
ncbi:MAG: YjbQ family protein, partial [Planctomycetota bacterium]